MGQEALFRALPALTGPAFCSLLLEAGFPWGLGAWRWCEPWGWHRHSSDTAGGSVTARIWALALGLEPVVLISPRSS